MELINEEIRNRTTIKYLKPIFDRSSIIANRLFLTIPQMGSVRSTSMVQQRFNEGLTEAYFSIEDKDGKNREIFRRDNKYYVGNLK
jgi:hypothetical protein